MHVITTTIRSKICSCILFYQLGLTEKDVFRHDFEIIFSDPSDANTNSITLLSDDTDEKPSMGTNPELNLSNLPETEVRSLGSLLLVIEVYLLIKKPAKRLIGCSFKFT